MKPKQALEAGETAVMKRRRLLKVKTLFVSGLPMDAKPRELYLLFRSFKVTLSRLPQSPTQPLCKHQPSSAPANDYLR